MNILHSFNKSQSTTLLINTLCIALWILPYILQQALIVPTEITIFGFSIMTFSNPLLCISTQIIAAIIIFVCVSLFVFPKYTNTISYLQINLMMLSASSWQAAQIFGSHTIATILVIIALLYMLSLDTNDNSVKILNVLILLILSSIFCVYFLWLIPVFLLGMIVLEGIKAKSIVLVLLVITVSAISIVGYAYLFDGIDTVKEYFMSISDFKTVEYSMEYVLNNAIFFSSIIFFVASISIYSLTQRDFNLRTKYIISFLIIIWVFLTLYILIFANGINIFSLLHTIITSLFVSLNFLDYRSKQRNTIFVVFISLIFVCYMLRFACGLLNYL